VTLPGATDDSDPNGDLLVSTLSLISPQAVDTDGDGDFDELTVAGEGVWTVAANGEVLFTPVAGFTGDPTPVPYMISDATGLVSNQALLTINYPQTAPVAQDITVAVSTVILKMILSSLVSISSMQTLQIPMQTVMLTLW